jgi:hypothetical protein
MADPDRSHGPCRLYRQRGACAGQDPNRRAVQEPSQTLEDAINHGRVAAVTAQGFTDMQGGLPIVVDGEVIGAIGASFDTPEHDVQIAQAGLNRTGTGYPAAPLDRAGKGNLSRTHFAHDGSKISRCCDPPASDAGCDFSLSGPTYFCVSHEGKKFMTDGLATDPQNRIYLTAGEHDSILRRILTVASKSWFAIRALSGWTASSPPTPMSIARSARRTGYPTQRR